MQAKRMLSTPCRFVVLLYKVADLAAWAQRPTLHSCCSTSASLCGYSYYYSIIHVIQSCFIICSEINVLRECTLPPIGELLAARLIQTAAHYFSFTVHTHVWFPKAGSKDPWTSSLQFIKSWPSAVCIMSGHLKCRFHLLQYFLPITSVSSYIIESKIWIQNKIVNGASVLHAYLFPGLWLH